MQDYQERYKTTNDYVSSNGEVKDSVKYIDNKGPEVCDVGNNGGYSNITKVDVEKLKTEQPYKLGNHYFRSAIGSNQRISLASLCDHY